MFHAARQGGRILFDLFPRLKNVRHSEKPISLPSFPDFPPVRFFLDSLRVDGRPARGRRLRRSDLVAIEGAGRSRRETGGIWCAWFQIERTVYISLRHRTPTLLLFSFRVALVHGPSDSRESALRKDAARRMGRDRKTRPSSNALSEDTSPCGRIASESDGGD